jgi:predicted N-formylglutamate amidohydrolase
MNPRALLAEDEPAAFEVVGATAPSPFLITCDHAGRRLPRALGSLGLSEAELESHIAWDIGAAAVARSLASALDAFLILQTYSRLVIDCNRPLGAATSIVERSEHTSIPGNKNVSLAEAELRARAVFHPYHERIRAEFDRRRARAQSTVYVAMHSFTPRFKGVDRPWDVGVLFNHDARLGRRILELLRLEENLVVGDNEPYSVSDLTDYGIVEHGERRGILHVELEMRQDLITDELGQFAWAKRLERVLRDASEGVIAPESAAGTTAEGRE